jgi:hypothetical protein
MNLKMDLLKKINLRELFFSIVFSFPFAIIFVFSNISSKDYGVFLLFLITFSLAVNFIIRISKKIGSGLTFFLAYSVLTFSSHEIGIVGWKKILTFFIAGLILEGFVFLFNKNRKLSYFLSTVVSITVLPLIAASFTSWHLTITFPKELLGMVLIAFIISLVVSLMVIVIWHFLRVNKQIIKLKTHLGNLNGN